MVIHRALEHGKRGLLQRSATIELIFKLIYQTSGVDKPIERAWFSSMTKGAIRDAFEHLRDDQQMKPLEAAARARETADWLVGYNATRAATVKVGSPRNPIPPSGATIALPMRPRPAILSHGGRGGVPLAAEIQ